MGLGLAIIGSTLALHAGAVVERCPTGVPTQTLTVVNRANVRPRALLAVERATVDQSLQLRAAWGTPCVRFGLGGWPITLTTGTPVHNQDGSVSDPITGEHPYVNGRPTAWITTGGATYAVWTRAFTHEVAEMLVDPALTTRWRLGLTEVCDPVENVTYSLDGVRVSDFVFPSYFSGGVGPWDQTRTLNAAYDTRMM